MLNFETKGIITEVTGGTVDFNGYKYKRCLANIADVNNFTVFIPVKMDVSVGDCLNISQCSLTNYHEDEQGHLSLRVEKFEIVPKEEFEAVSEFRVRANGMVVKTEKSVVKKIGPTAKPLLKATLMIFNEHSKVFKVLLVGFCASVKTLLSIESGKYIDATAVLRTQYTDKTKYQLTIEEFNYAEKGDLK